MVSSSAVRSPQKYEVLDPQLDRTASSQQRGPSPACLPLATTCLPPSHISPKSKTEPLLQPLFAATAFPKYQVGPTEQPALPESPDSYTPLARLLHVSYFHPIVRWLGESKKDHASIKIWCILGEGYGPKIVCSEIKCFGKCPKPPSEKSRGRGGGWRLLAPHDSMCHPFFRRPCWVLSTTNQTATIKLIRNANLENHILYESDIFYF